MRAFVNGILIVKDELLAGKVLVFDDTISKIVDEIPTDCEIIDLKGAYVSAGLIDVHIHGFAGYDVMDADVSGLQKMCDELVKFGVTSFCPTTMTQGSEQIKEALTSVKQLKLTQKVVPN